MGRIVCVCVGLAAVAVGAAVGEEPRNPGAVVSCPDWLKAGAPFDVEAFFTYPAPGRNAAPLYFEAFAEFGADADACLTAAGMTPVAAAGGRQERIGALHEANLKQPEKIDREAADALLADLSEGFRKLAAAQRRPECVFATGLATDMRIPHAQLARVVARAARLRAFRDVEDGEIERPIRDVASLLRLSRDLRPRGIYISQLVSASIDHVALLQILPALLRSPALKVEHCDRLTAVLREHESTGLDRFATGAKGEYVMLRTLLRALQDRRFPAAGPDGRPVDEPVSDDRAASLLGPTAKVDAEGAWIQPREGIEALILHAWPDWIQEHRVLDDFAAAMTAPATSRYSERMRRFHELAARHLVDEIPAPLWLAQLFTPAYRDMALSAARSDFYIDASLSLIAIRRWRSTHGGADPDDLAAACKEAGLPTVPADPFGDGPLKMTALDAGLVVYSIGPDGVDDRALEDSDLARRPQGDVILSMPGR
ncbi:hypothetical protein [Paludisphaera mucosa]|uniref:Uncharacterized protein n=1 Tax=Paludisphaera mucosa TaxID=3030827 RepID=A0ABT6FIJ4_9BACT|nr:hypothetical protein [Paludisphaera mucosa]MDG3007367.1 hypothetical protein [Paludisphaera mucosa]